MSCIYATSVALVVKAHIAANRINEGCYAIYLVLGFAFANADILIVILV